jgi:high-affinity nickel-transport protein
MATVAATPSISRYEQFRGSLNRDEWRRSWAMLGAIFVLHIVGFGIFIAFVVPQHYKGLGIGVATLAYTLGLRHAFDADHISAIDNTTRKLMNERRGTSKPKPLSIGFWFSLGHSTIVVAIGVGIVVAEKTVFPAVSNSGSHLETFGGIFGTVVSAGFLYLIALLNIVILGGIWRVFRSMRRGDYNEAELERQLQNRGLMYRYFGRWMRAITKEWQMYPVGVVFGMGFDTATEVALLATTALLATQHLPFYAIICLPILFTAGMSLMDTADGVFMNVAYGWAFFNPVRKVYYNLAITGLSVAICFFIGTIEVLGLAPMELHWNGRFWNDMANFDINKAGFVIVGMFVLTWIAALAIWRYAHIEEKWSARLQSPTSITLPESGPSSLNAPYQATHVSISTPRVATGKAWNIEGGGSPGEKEVEGSGRDPL